MLAPGREVRLEKPSTSLEFKVRASVEVSGRATIVCPSVAPSHTTSETHCRPTTSSKRHNERRQSSQQVEQARRSAASRQTAYPQAQPRRGMLRLSRDLLTRDQLEAKIESLQQTRMLRRVIGMLGLMAVAWFALRVSSSSSTSYSWSSLCRTITEVAPGIQAVLRPRHRTCFSRGSGQVTLGQSKPFALAKIDARAPRCGRSQEGRGERGL